MTFKPAIALFTYIALLPPSAICSPSQGVLGHGAQLRPLSDRAAKISEVAPELQLPEARVASLSTCESRRKAKS